MLLTQFVVSDFYSWVQDIVGFPGGSDDKESAYNMGDSGLIPGLGRSPGIWEWLPIPVFLPGEFHGRKSLVGYSPWGCKEMDLTEQLTFSCFFQGIIYEMI